MNNSQHEKCLSFFAIIHADVTNHLHREIFADWLDDQGMDKEALGQRWLARNKREIDLGITRVGGWWTRPSGEHPKADLPMIFTNNDRYGTDVISPSESTDCELAFMKRCTELVWDESGEPISELQLQGIEK